MLDPNQIAKFRQQTATPRKRSVAGSWTRLCGTCKQPAIIRGGKTRKVGGRTVFTCAGCLTKLLEKPDDGATVKTGTGGELHHRTCCRSHSERRKQITLASC